MSVAYTALALQVRCAAINALESVEAARARMAETLARLGAQIAMAKRVIGPELRLVVLPEYFLTGFPLDETVEGWAAKAALHAQGAEYAALARIAAESDLYLSGNAYETDAHFPGLYFQVGFVIAPDGTTVLRYRRLISMYAASPFDVWDRYLDLYGLDAVFPVARTAIGALAAVASEEILYPELARAHAMRGAELLLHATAEYASPRQTAKEICRIARAAENMAYVVSANSAGIEGTDIAAGSTDALSKIVDFRGLVLAEAGYGESLVAHAEIDLAALRRHRARPGMGNLLARQPYPLYAAAYAQGDAHPPNTLLAPDGSVTVPERRFFRARQEAVIEKLARAGAI